ncbi:HrgA protein [Neisseriaceae bacterium ESL0693]|nr:HrgA protein [Neisseriaceae bacterium ESL0693]
MGTKLNLSQCTAAFLKDHAEVKYTAREIAQWIFEHYPEACAAKKEASKVLHTDADLIQQLVAEISGQRPHMQRRHPNIKVTEGKPRRYYYSDKSDETEIAEAEMPVTTDPVSGLTKWHEADLYPLLSQYLAQELALYSRRIDEKTSSNRQGSRGNHWLHPDIVALENLSADWDREVSDCVQVYSIQKTKLWSFEVKLKINTANVRECFFQAVSNSSWANLGYLVASEFNGRNIMKELRMLATAHGIGIMQLDMNNPAESQILLPARERDEIDWDMVNRLATENKDFMAYVVSIRKFYQTGGVNRHEWDGVPYTQ